MPPPFSGVGFEIQFTLNPGQFGQVEAVANALAKAVDRLAPPIVLFRLWGAGLTLIEGANIKMNLKNNQQVHGQLIFKTALSGVAAIDPESPVFESTAPDHFTVESPDPTIPGAGKATFLLKANPQSPSDDTAVGLVKCTFDGDAGDGLKQREAQLAVNVIPGDAEITELSVGAPEDQAAVIS